MPTFLAITEEQLIAYFKDKKAISTNSAINLNIEDLKNKLDIPEFLEKDLSTYGYIKRTKDNKYYLDTRIMVQQTKMLVKIIIIIGIILLIPTVFTFLMWIFSW